MYGIPLRQVHRQFVSYDVSIVLTSKQVALRISLLTLYTTTCIQSMQCKASRKLPRTILTVDNNEDPFNYHYMIQI